jgi:hypothetical protein
MPTKNTPITIRRKLSAFCFLLSVLRTTLLDFDSLQIKSLFWIEGSEY